MNRSSQVLSVLSVSLAAFGLLANAVLEMNSKKPSQSQSKPPANAVELDGPKPIEVDCIKKPVPIFTVYQY